MLELSVKCKARFRRHLQFFSRYRRVGTLPQSSLEHPRKGIAPPWSLQEPSAYYEMNLCHSRGGSLTTAYKLETGHQQDLQGDHRAPNATKLSRRCRLPRVTSRRLSLDQEKPNACGVCSRWLSLALMRSKCGIKILKSPH
jgi:hypothetical protein